MTTNGTVSLELATQTAWLRRLARALVRDAATADDLVQDTFAIAATHAPADRPLGPWLVRVLRNLHRLRTRAASRRTARERAVAAFAAPPATPAELVDRVEVQRLLAGLVLELPPQARDVILLAYVEGLSAAAIARRLAVPAATVRWRHQQALAALRRRLDQRSRAWLPALAALAGPSRAIGVALPVLVAAAIATVAVAGWIVGQLHAAPVVAQARVAPRPPSPPALLAGATAPDDPARPAFPRAAITPLPSGLIRVEGRVIDDHRAPVFDADVTYACGGELAVSHVRSDAAGAFAVTVEPDCSLDVYARKGERAGRSGWSRMSDLGVIAQLEARPIATVRVVDDATGAPIAGAQVSAITEFDPVTREDAVTDAAGIARVAVPVVPAALRDSLNLFTELGARAAGYTPSFDVLGKDPSPAPIVRTIALDRGVAIRGLVVDPAGAPVPGAAIDVTVRSRGRTPGVYSDRRGRDAEVTDRDGRFAIAVPGPGSFELLPHSDALIAADPVIVEVGPAGRADVVIPLVRRAEVGVTGIVLGPDGAPVAGARVVTPRTGTLPTRPDLPPAITDEHGRFAIPEIRRAYRLTARKGDLASELVTFERTARRHELTLTLGPTGLAGVAVDRDGFVVPGAELYLNACCNGAVQGQRTFADASGHFAFLTPRGTFTLSVRRTSDDDFLDDDDVRAPSGSLDLRIVVP